MQRVLVLGVPRSGTTWVAQALARSRGAVYVHEPDGVVEPFAYRAQRRDHLLHYPTLHAGDDAPELARLWDGAFAGGRRDPSRRDALARRLYRRVSADDKVAARVGGRPTVLMSLVERLAVPPVAAPGAAAVVVKSVHAALASEWIAARWQPRVLVVHRDLRNVTASWLALGFGGTRREVFAGARAEAARRWDLALPDYDDPAMRSVAFCAVMMLVLHENARTLAGWELVAHEDVCVDSAAKLAAVAGRLGLEWTADADDFVVASDRPGAGYATNRVAQDLPDQWKRKLDAQQVDAITTVLAEFPEDLWLVPPHG